jgi:hypothetical protein
MVLEEKLIIGLLIVLCIMGVFIYMCPESFFMVYDKILYFLEVI